MPQRNTNLNKVSTKCQLKHMMVAESLPSFTEMKTDLMQCSVTMLWLH